MERTSDYRALRPEDVGREIADLARSGKTVVSGDALDRYGEMLRGTMPDQVVFLPEQHWMPSPAVIAAMGLRFIEEGRILDLAASEPLYLRVSEAERQAGKNNGPPGHGTS